MDNQSDCYPQIPVTIHFEGLPSSGKTTASERFCKLLRSLGVDASWWLEEAADHPVNSHTDTALSRKPGYPQVLLDSWLKYLETSSGTVILDGYALQSTVRILYASLVSKDEIEDYFNCWQQLAPKMKLVYFTVEHPAEHFDLVLAERGDQWADKLFTYVARTPIGVANCLKGRAGFIEFWADYQKLCQSLLRSVSFPVYFIDSRCRTDDDLAVVAASAGLIP